MPVGFMTHLIFSRTTELKGIMELACALAKGVVLSHASLKCVHICKRTTKNSLNEFWMEMHKCCESTKMNIQRRNKRSHILMGFPNKTIPKVTALLYAFSQRSSLGKQDAKITKRRWQEDKEQDWSQKISRQGSRRTPGTSEMLPTILLRRHGMKRPRLQSLSTHKEY